MDKKLIDAYRFEEERRMSDFISRDKAVAAVLATSIEYQLIYGKKEPKEGFVRSLIKSIANIPQEEAERKHGKWTIFDSQSDKVVDIKCSECKKGFSVDADKWCDIGFTINDLHYCPNCGCRMDERKEE